MNAGVAAVAAVALIWLGYHVHATDRKARAAMAGARKAGRNLAAAPAAWWKMLKAWLAAAATLALALAAVVALVAALLR